MIPQAQLVLDVHNGNPITVAELRVIRPAALIAKATEGTSFEDRTLEQHREAARACGAAFGSYLFLHPGSNGSEARFFLDYSKPRRGEFVAVDVEVTDGHPMGHVAARAWSCCSALVAAGHRPLLYCSSSWWAELVANEPRLRTFLVWEAQYPGRFTRWFPALAGRRTRLGNHASVALWQWTDAYRSPAGRFFDASRLMVPLSTLTEGGAR